MCNIKYHRLLYNNIMCARRLIDSHKAIKLANRNFKPSNQSYK